MVYLSGLLYNESQQVFRTVFKLKNRTVLHWFPGHMGKGVKDMQKKLKSVDCIVEVHDARIPFSGRNPESFQTVSGLRPHILVYNKRDLANEDLESVIINKHKENGFQNILFTNCKDQKCNGIKRLVPLVQKQILSSHRYNRSENRDYCLMVIGVPNVGKSSLINTLRNKNLLKKNAAHVGAVPGITRSVGEKIKISDDPLIYVLDTPGILSPKVPSVDVGMKLALCATIPDKEVGIELIADYLLFWLNKHSHFGYTDFLGIDNPSDNISEALSVFAMKNNFTMKVLDCEGKRVLKPNLNLAAVRFVDAFRRGIFGKFTLDIDEIHSPNIKSSHKPLIYKRVNVIK
ncbi:mitochondrial GTPase 1 [Homalodisca vitripennis]|uniref:mitochondrial GTPase 1 n=1 Tax=Homalodisca vitripennis TaxID=197043 RepID=UPI001EEAFFEE|nr:mitochondrial GTPase 1 [Homalodisca vitripennis]